MISLAAMRSGVFMGAMTPPSEALIVETRPITANKQATAGGLLDSTAWLLMRSRPNVIMIHATPKLNTLNDVNHVNDLQRGET